MGYSIRIGEATINYDRDDQSVGIGCEQVTHPDAPGFHSHDDKSNSIAPSFSAWHELCHEAGITELFHEYGGPCREGFHRETSLLSGRAQPLLEGDLDYIRRARIRREQTNSGDDSALSLLRWLEFWIEWALENCKIPIVWNLK